MGERVKKECTEDGYIQYVDPECCGSGKQEALRRTSSACARISQHRASLASGPATGARAGKVARAEPRLPAKAGPRASDPMQTGLTPWAQLGQTREALGGMVTSRSLDHSPYRLSSRSFGADPPQGIAHTGARLPNSARAWRHTNYAAPESWSLSGCHDELPAAVARVSFNELINEHLCINKCVYHVSI